MVFWYQRTMLRHLRLLHWTTAAALGLAAASLLARQIHGGGRRPHLAIAVGAAEVAGALLFVVPATVRTGGAILLLTLVVAAAMHGAMGESPPVAFLVYGAAIWTVVRAHRLAKDTFHA
jgi:hypothetical protein